MALVAEQSAKLEMRFGEGLKRVRLREGLKQEALARLAGYTDHTNIVKIERGKTLPSLDKALALAKVLNVPVEEFVRPSHANDGLWRTIAALGDITDPLARTHVIRLLRCLADDLEKCDA